MLAIIATSTIFACQDMEAPTGLRPDGPRLSTVPSGIVTVLPDSMRGWTFYNDQAGVACGDTAVCRLVDGPGNAPRGSGSAELATTSGSDGKALILVSYLGTRLDRVTALRYSTLRQSADAGNNLAIALQLNADFDLTDGSVGYQGRLVFEPYQGNGGNVVRNAWQSWDTKSGRWWGTRTSVPRSGALVANPCVQSSPCTWGQLLAAFPNVGIHATYGAIVLKAGSGWIGFRGNVDDVTIGVDGQSTTFDFERAVKTISLAYDCGRRFTVANRTTTAQTLAWRVRGTVDSGVVSVAARAIDGSAATSSFTTALSGMTLLMSNGVVVDSAANTGATCAGYRLRVLADEGVVFSVPTPRDTIYSPGATVSYALGTTTSDHSLMAILDDTLAAASGTILMDRDHVLQAETELPLIPSSAVAHLGARVRAVYYSSAPQQAFMDFMDWYNARAETVGAALLSAQLDTASFLFISDADEPAMRQFEDRVVGTEFLFYPKSGGGTGSYYMTPEWNGYEPGGIASRAPSAEALRAIRSRRMALAERGALRSRSSERASGQQSLSAMEDGQPDEQTHLLYVNGIWTPEFSLQPGAPSAAATTEQLLRRATKTPRFGMGGELRSHVVVALVYNRSMVEDIRTWKESHNCEATYQRESKIRKPLHSLRRLAVCKVAPFLLWVVKNDALEAAKQVAQIELRVGPIAEDARKVAYAVRESHMWPAHVLLVGHSQGNLMIAQALSELPSIEPRPINFGDDGCTAALTLASPVRRAAFRGPDTHHVRGLIVAGDALMQIGLSNDFDVIRTPAGDSVDAMEDMFARLKQGAEAHYVDKNYFLNEAAALRVGAELTLLSDECSAGSFTIAPSQLSLAYWETSRITPEILNRAGRPLLGRSFYGGVNGVEITKDSLARAYLPTNGVITGIVNLSNTQKVFATIGLSVSRPPFNVPLAISTREWWETVYYSGKIGAHVEKTPPPRWDGQSPCAYSQTFANDTVTLTVARRCEMIMRTNVAWVDYPGVRYIGVSTLSPTYPTSGGGLLWRNQADAVASGELLTCNDACLSGGYVVRTVNDFTQVITADTIGAGGTFARLPSGSSPGLRSAGSSSGTGRLSQPTSAGRSGIVGTPRRAAATRPGSTQ